MNDVQDEIRVLLRAKANDVAPHTDVPAPLTKRVRRRIARNAAVASVSAAVAIVLAIAAVGTVDEPAERSLGDGAFPTCTSGDLDATPVLEGAAGSRVGTIEVANALGGVCSLSGRPDIAFVDADSNVLARAEVAEVEPTWQVQGTPQPDGWPVVTLQPHDVAMVRFAWSNWCATDTPLVQLSAHDGEVLATASIDPGLVPPCNGPTEPATVQVGPFEPTD